MAEDSKANRFKFIDVENDRIGEAEKARKELAAEKAEKKEAVEKSGMQVPTIPPNETGMLRPEEWEEAKSYLDANRMAQYNRIKSRLGETKAQEYLTKMMKEMEKNEVREAKRIVRTQDTINYAPSAPVDSPTEITINSVDDAQKLVDGTLDTQRPDWIEIDVSSDDKSEE